MEEELTNIPDIQPEEADLAGGTTMSLNAMFRDYWVDYASDVILDRSVPHINDGLKPVQRRILHTMHEKDDGRFNKVQSIVGATMDYHPHGDASIKDALVNMGQKDLLIDCQGNWGNILTGDDAAAGRYIEARLSKFAKEVVFNDKTTHWIPSYDGRKREPETLPIKFPLLLSQGTKGIAVTLTSVILPHNFCELITASINILRDEPFEIYPDFPTGGMIDVSRYNDGAQGGRLRIRAKMHYDEKRKAIVITEVPYGVTVGDIQNSIVKANEKGKIKIKKVEDNTAATAEIVVYLPSGISPDQTIDALYAFSSCQVSFSPQTCVIVDNKPVFMTISDILRHSTMRTKELLRQELVIQLGELEDRWHWVSLEKIFFEKGIYKVLEKKNYASWDTQVTGIERAFEQGYIRAQEDPFFHDIGFRTASKKNSSELEVVHDSVDASMAVVVRSAGYDRLLACCPLGQIVFNVDPDADRFVAGQVVPASERVALGKLGITAVPLGDERVFALYSPNQFFLMLAEHVTPRRLE